MHPMYNKYLPVAIALALASPAKGADLTQYIGNDFAYEDSQEVRYVVGSPFGPVSLAAYSTMAGKPLPSIQSPILSYTYRISKKDEITPAGTRVFSYQRVAVFDVGPIFDEFNAIAARFRKNGCSKTKVSDAQLIGRNAKRLLVRIEFKHKERKCAGSWNTDVGSAEGDVVFSVNFTERFSKPYLEIKKESSSLDASVLGMDINSLAGRFIGGLLRALGVLYSNPINIGDAIGSFELSLMKPMRSQVVRQLSDNPGNAIPSIDLQSIRTAFGDIARAFENSQASTMNFNYQASGFGTRTIYTSKTGAVRKLSNELCTEITDLPPASQYCQSTGRQQLVMILVDEIKPRSFFRSSLVEISSREARAMESTKSKSFTETWPENGLLWNISRKHYGSESEFLTFFNENNKEAECYWDNVSNKRLCNYVIMPLWMYYQKQIPARGGSRHPLAPGSDVRSQIEYADAQFQINEVY